MALQTTAVATQLLTSDHAVTTIDTNATIFLQHRNDIFYKVRAEML
jgi:hypothetical protein